MKTAIYITFKNYLGGYEYFPFVAYHDEGIDILDSMETDVNLFPNWPNSYGEFATTVTKQTKRIAKKTMVIRSQYMSRNRLDALKYVKVSSLVMMLTNKFNARVLIPDDGSFTVVRGKDKVFALQFTVTYTDYLPSQ